MQIYGIAHQTAEDLAEIKTAFSHKNDLEEVASVRSWLLPNGIDPETDFESASRLCHPSTGRWFLDSNTFRDWLNSGNGFFWVYGIRMHPCYRCWCPLTI
jgi:hypothetical protein